MGNEETSIDEAWRNFGFVIVNDACEEWLEHSVRINRLDKKEAERGLTWGERETRDNAKANRRMCEKWMRSDFCYSLCGIEGETLLDGLKARLKEKEDGD